MGNKLVPQHYCEMVIEYVNSKYSIPLINGVFTENGCYNYCIKNTEVLDPGDDVKIKHIIKLVLEELVNKGYVVKSRKAYFVLHYVDENASLYISEKPREMRTLTPEAIQRLKSLNVSMADDPMSKLGAEEDEKV